MPRITFHEDGIALPISNSETPVDIIWFIDRSRFLILDDITLKLKICDNKQQKENVLKLTN